MALLLGIDLGTSYFKIGLFDQKGELKGLGRKSVEKAAPHPGWTELAIDEFWRAIRGGLAEALIQAEATTKDIVGISYSSQASTFVLLDERDEPLTPLIVWTDSRGLVSAEDAAFSATEQFQTKVGFRHLTPQASPAKWRWFQQKAPALWRRTRRILTISDYFLFALTGERVGDASTVAFLGLFDLGSRAWWTDALRQFEVDHSTLSKPLRPGSSAGRTSVRARAWLGLEPGIPVAVGGLDHHVAAIGSGLERLADASISTGTVLAALVLVDEAKPYAECYHGGHVDGARLWRLAFDPNGAGQLEDYQRNAAPDRSIEALLDEAAQAPRGAAWRDSESRGSAVRGILERVALTHRELIRRVVGTPADDLGAVRSVVATGGGARSPLWLQINADILGVPVVTPACAERACLGAAAFAAVAAGLYSSIHDATAVMIRPERVFEPNAKAVEEYAGKRSQELRGVRS